MTHMTTFRPFSQIIGQERAIHFLKRVMSKKKIPHAYLFSGISGIGKTTVALAFTQALNCHDSINGEGCGRCPPCRQIISGNFPDLAFIEPEGQHIRIEQIRGLTRAISFKLVSGLYRVSIIRQAGTMTEEAANAFLKTLEEPPPGNILVLSVTEPLDLLPTIVSRCQKIPFLPIPVRDIADWLIKQKGVDETKALLLARISEGSLGKAIHLCDSNFYEKRHDHLSRIIRLPKLTSEQALEMALEYTEREKKKVADASSKEETGLFELLSVWKTWYRDLLLMKVKSPVDWLINFDFSHKLKKISKNYSMKVLTDSLLLIDQAQVDLLHTRNLDLMMENTILTLREIAHKKEGQAS